MKYRREIDGLRAIAILPVILFHAGFKIFSGGYVGVDIFFVISGYLITSIIINEKSIGSFSLFNFYLRRARRILPALFTVITVCIPFAWAWLTPQDMKYFSQSILSALTFLSNIYFYFKSNYFDVSNDLKPLIHIWSLGVEEQFYLIFPIFILLIWPQHKKNVQLLFLAIITSSIILAQSIILNNPTFAFYMLPTRAWEFLLGALVSYHLDRRNTGPSSQLINQLASMIGAFLILIAIFGFNKDTPIPSLYTLIPTIGACLIIAYANQSTLVGKLLASNALTGVGLISYSLYLWHQPLLAFFRYRSYENYFIYLLLLLNFILAYTTWKYIEKPFRKIDLFTNEKFLKYAIAGAIFLLTVGLLGQFTNGYEKYYQKNRLSPEQLEFYSLVKNQTGKDLSELMFDNNDCNFWSSSLDEKSVLRYKKCHEKYGKGFIILGDSHAMNFYNIIAKTHEVKFLFGLSKGGCRPVEENSLCQYSEFDKFLSQHVEKIEAIFYTQASVRIENPNFLLDRSISSDNNPLEFKYLKLISSYLTHLSERAKVIWVGPFLEARVNFRPPKLLNKPTILN